MKKIGLDIGFGDVKYVCDNTINKYPSAIAYATEYEVDLGAHGASVKKYLYEDKSYIVGEQAVINAFPTRNIEFLLEYAPLFVAHTRHKLDFDTIAIGLPVGHYSKAKEFKERLSSITIDGLRQEYAVHVLPQGLGVLYDHMLGDRGQIVNQVNDCLILDVGFNTVDILVYSKGKVLRADAMMMEGQGICQVTAELFKMLNAKYNDTLSEQEAKEILKSKVYRQYGTVVDLSPHIASICSRYADKLISEVAQRFDHILKRTTKLLIAGGGAHLLADNIPLKYQRMVEIVRPNGSEYANAAGFFKYLGIIDAKNTR
jgi:actin-like ATPase involved in cell morphogenesis